MKGQVSVLPIKIYKNPVVQIKYKGRFTRKQIKKLAQEQSERLKEENKFKGQISVSLKYPIGWRSGYFTDFGDHVILYDHSDSDNTLEEPDTFKEFRVYVMKTKTRKGGCNKTNDCLYDALKEIIPLELPWESPEELKSYLNLKRNDKISIDDIEKIEEQIKQKISVTGDHIYTSIKKSDHVIKLTLLNGHYTLKNEYITQKGIANEEKIPLIYQRDNENNNYRVYNKKRYRISIETFQKIRNKPRSSEYTLIPIEENKTLEETYEDFIKNANLLKEETNLINLYKTGTNKKTALDLFYKLNRCINPELIEQDEAIWIQNASYSAMCWADNYEGKAYKYDVCSMYPSIMKDHQMLFPLKRGTFKKLTKEEFNNLKFYMYGIYRAKIKGNKLFRANKKNYYTHIDLNRAKDLNLEIELIIDKEPNILHYPRKDLIQGDKLFGSYVDLLFKLKKKKIKIAKKLLNILWGSLTEKNTIKISIDDNGNTEEIKDNRTLLSINPINDTQTMIQFVKNDNYYETNYARIAPFLLAKGRFLITKLMKPYINNIKRVHTDGIISDIKLDFDSNELVLNSQGLGKMKYEGYCKNCIIHNNIRIEGTFKV